MNIHEYQAKAILRAYGVPVPRGAPARTAEAALAAAKKLGGPCVVKAQIHAGGRGKAGGVQLVRTAREAERAARVLIGKTLVTPQTGPQGRKVRRLYVEEASEIAAEYYLSLVLDRSCGWPALVASPAGGMAIEEVAAATPEKILQLPLDPVIGVRGFHAQRVAAFLGLPPKAGKALAALLPQLYRAFWDKDMALLEINPLIATRDDALICLDAKMSFDENALFRHQKDIAPLYDKMEDEPAERKAAEHGLSYIKLDGAIGCMVNGAGLAMATMDIIKLYGSAPANFLDVGGGASQEKVMAAFRLILSDASVRGILVNIFGGIMRCDIIANGILGAAQSLKLSVPLVVRLAGTHAEEGKAILAGSDLRVIAADTLDDAAQKIVAAVS